MTTIVPHESLKPETLDALLEEFVTRDGAVHGHQDTPTDRQIEAVRKLLTSGKAVIVFDDETESCTICLTDAKGQPIADTPGPGSGGRDGGDEKRGRRKRDEDDDGPPERRFVPDEG
ncbi:MAG: YheU family protein [Planctomycetota bacterium]|nr:YheU family protein [Planctomycetota bacterium]